jgi:gamma-glutamylcyclotransferase (GGCT)/AIG2-like uncharacterized protein YtfP
LLSSRVIPGLRLDQDAGLVEVEVLESFELPDQWVRLDAFEGPGYHREVTTVETESGTLSVNIYVLSGD